jgi:hypothetical protein
MDVPQFWADCRAASLELQAAKTKIPGQPSDPNLVYIQSKKDRKFPTVKVVTMLCGIKLAGQRICEETHELAPAEAISAFLEDAAKRKAEIENQLSRQKGNIQFTQQPRPVEVSK